MCLPLPFVNPKWTWWRFYSRALRESDPKISRFYVKKALDAIDKKLNQPLDSKELQAMSSAVLHLIEIEREELRKKAA